MSTYQEQVDRLYRSYGRLKDINDGRPHSEASDHYTDDMYVFFMNCHHLKDWLGNDQDFPASKSEIEDYVDENRALCLAADICNAQKHLSLRANRSAENPSLGQRVNRVLLGGGTPNIAVSFTINTDSGPEDAFQLATQCLDLWDHFIAKHDARD